MPAISSIYPVDPSDVETFTVVTNPIRTYTSSSTGGATGSIHLFARRSSIQKDIVPDSSFVDSSHDDADLSSLLQAAQMVGKGIVNASGLTNVTGTFYAQFVSNVLVGVAWPGPADPFLSPVTSSLANPYLSGTHLVSASSPTSGTIVPGTATYLASGAFQFSNAELAGDLTAVLDQYLLGCTAQEQALRLQETLDVNRFSPPPVFNSNTLRKLAIKDMLNVYYRASYPSAQYAYTNYSSLNFFTCSTGAPSAALLYPNIDGGDGGLVFHEGYCSGTYTPSGSFSFDFYINPRYQQDQRDGVFHAGTIMHLSSTFALSLVSGSGKDQNGKASGFRLQLQLSTSADIPPSHVYRDAAGTVHLAPSSGSSFNTSLVFMSNDNVLQLNSWHHVVVRWGTNLVNNGTGTFNVDGQDVGTFVVPAGSIAPSLADIIAFGSASHIYQKIPGVAQEQPTVLVLGNYYDGPNNSDGNAQAMFFAQDPATRDGVNVLWQDAGIETPAAYTFNHPLKAELHDVAIRRCYMSDADIAFSASRGPTYLDNTFALYVPPFFTSDAPYKQFVNDHGGILVTPFEEADGTTTTPFSVALSFGVAGHYINLDNFVKDFASEQFPLLHHLTGVAITTTTDAETCNEFLYAQPFVLQRNLTILPCDDGLFVPSYQLLVSETTSRAVDDLGNPNLSIINLDDMVNTGTLLFGAGAFDDGSQPQPQVSSFSNLQLGTTTTTPFAPAGPALLNYLATVQSGSDVEAGAPLDVYQQTQDPSSNEVVIFDISNLFYGFQISPTNLSLVDPDLGLSSLVASSIVSGSNLYVTGTLSSTPGSHGYNAATPVRITLADDGMGNVYRADCLTSQSMWNSVGNVYYGEGLVVLKSPHLMFFGTEQYALNLRGEQHVHVMKIDCFAPNNQLNSSSNPTWIPVPPTGYPNDPEDEFVYITGLNLHDSDYNVVMKTTLAQPIAKRSGDRVLFKIRHDW